MSNTVYNKKMENLRNRFDIRLVSNEKDYLKLTSKLSYMSHRKSKVTLTLDKPANVGMCILELSKVLMYEFHCDYIKNKYGNNSRLLFTDTDSLMYEIKTEIVYEDFNSDKVFHFSNYLTKSKYYDDSNKLAIAKMKDEATGVGKEEFVGLKPKMYSFQVDNNIEHKKAKDMDKNVAGTISHNEYKDLLLNNKCLRYSMNIIQNKGYRIGTYEIHKMSLSCFDDKIYIQNNGYDGLAHGYQS